MKLKEIHRTSTFAWSPGADVSLLATGTVAGALDASFSNDSQLELWEPDFLNSGSFHLGEDGQPGPKATITTSSRFNRIVWGHVSQARPQGVIAAGMENGELALWDPSKILAGEDSTSSLIVRNATHTGPVRALGANPIQTNLLSSGATNGEVFIWDLNNPAKSYSPGTRSSKLDDVTALAWNALVPHILGSSSSSGYTAVWDLRTKKEVVALAYGGGAATSGGPMGGALAQGGRRGMSDVAWHPDNATRLVTSSEDDSSPVIMVWDLRNARAPEKILTGHEKGVLSLAWCRQDPDLLLSCGKDNRTICWNPQSFEMLGELPMSNNWAFSVQWCPRNPDLLATASFDGTVGIHSLQTTNNKETADAASTAASQADGADIFNTGNFGMSAPQSTLSLKQPPKWLRRPVSASFGFGGQIVSVSNLPGAHGGHQSSSVHLRQFATEPIIVERAQKLEAATDAQKLADFAQDKSTESTGEKALEGWKALLSLFRANTRDELVTLLGFSKEEVAVHVAEAIKKVKASSQSGTTAATPAPATNVIPPEDEEEDVTESKPYEPVVSFAEPEREPEPLSEPTEGPPGEGDTTVVAPVEATPSEVSASATSGGQQEAESTATEPSLFDDEVVIGTPQGDANADFFATMGTARSALPEHVLVPHHSYAADSSVAATIGSRPSSAASDTLKTTTFKIYPNDASDIDKLLTKSLVLGDLESAVSLCLSVDRFADAILLAVKGGPELLQRTQTAYFTRQTTTLPYLRLYQSIVSNDLDDIVQNADLREWQEIFVILCTFAREDEFSGLAKQLGQRLEFQGKVAKAADPHAATTLARDYRKDATLCYLAAGKLEQVVNIWIEEMKEEETVVVGEEKGASRYTSHALALQTFVEKVTVFRSATKYVDADLTEAATAAGGDRSYKLAALYDRYFEYADLLAAQGMLKEAVKYLAMTPGEYKGTHGAMELDFDIARERVMLAAGIIKTPTTQAVAQVAAPVQQQSQSAYQTKPAASQYGPYGSAAPTSYTQPPVPATTTSTTVKPSPYAAMYAPPNGSTAPAQQQQQQQQQPSANDPYAPASGTSNQAQQQPTQQYRPTGGAQYGTFVGGTAYGQQQQYGGVQQHQQPAYGQPLVPPPGPLAPPPQRIPPKRTDQGWNDTPVVDTTAVRRAPPSKSSTPAPITSPFPNAQPANGSPTSPYAAGPPSRAGGQFPPGPPPPHQQGQGQLAPPPPRGGSAMGRPPPPPQQGGSQFRPPPGTGQTHNPPPFTRPVSTGPGNPAGVTYPVRAMSPLSRAGGGYPPDRANSPLAQGQPGVRQGPPPQGPPPPRGPGGGPPPPHPQQQQQQQQAGMPPRGTPPIRGPPPGGNYGPGPGQGGPGPYGGQPRGPGPAPPGPGGYAPGPGGSRLPPPAGGQPPQMGMQSPPPPSAGPPAPVKPAAAAPKAPKYPPGDRDHIPDNAKAAYTILNEALNRLRQTTPPQQRRMADDTERRLNALFDALNCETLSPGLVEQLNVLTQAMERRDQQVALATHMDMLTKSSGTEDIALWMSGVKLLILRM